MNWFVSCLRQSLEKIVLGNESTFLERIKKEWSYLNACKKALEHGRVVVNYPAHVPSGLLTDSMQLDVMGTALSQLQKTNIGEGDIRHALLQVESFNADQVIVSCFLTLDESKGGALHRLVLPVNRRSADKGGKTMEKTQEEG